MTKVNYERKLQKFFVNNQDLISDYEAMDCVVPVTYCESDIIDAYHKYIKINKSADFNSTLFDAFSIAIRQGITIVDAMEGMMYEEASESKSYSSAQQYFKEINNIYNRHNNDYNIEYCEENRDKLIEMNLKTVISIAKRYQGLGLTLNELISAGNLGLVIAYDKFDPSRSKLKDNVMDSVKDLPEEFSYNELEAAVNEYLQYGDIKKKFEDTFNHSNIIHKKDLIKWINSNIYNAKFNSIATMWIRAYILIEIDNYSRIVKKPKSEIYKDREEFGAYKKEVTIDIDAPVSDDSNSSVIDVMNLDELEEEEMSIEESYTTFKQGLQLLLSNVKVRDRSIFLKKFGIGIPRPMSPREIADQEGLSIARVSQIFQNVLEQVQRNQIKYNISEDIMMQAVKGIL